MITKSAFIHGKTWNGNMGNDINREEAGNYFRYNMVLSGDGKIVAIGASFINDNESYSSHIRVFEWVNLA